MIKNLLTYFSNIKFCYHKYNVEGFYYDFFQQGSFNYGIKTYKVLKCSNNKCNKIKQKLISKFTSDNDEIIDKNYRFIKEAGYGHISEYYK